MRSKKYRGFTLEKLALVTEMELKQLSRIEYGIINTTVFQINRLCYSLNVNLGELFGLIPLKDAKNSNTINF